MIFSTRTAPALDTDSFPVSDPKARGVFFMHFYEAFPGDIHIPSDRNVMDTAL